MDFGGFAGAPDTSGDNFLLTAASGDDTLGAGGGYDYPLRIDTMPGLGIAGGGFPSDVSITSTNNMAGGGGGGAGGGGGGLWGDISGFLKDNKWVLPAAGLAGTAISQMTQPGIPNLGAMQSQASGLNDILKQFSPVNMQGYLATDPTLAAVRSAANALIPAEQTGQLATGQQSLVDQALQDNITRLKSNAASRGQSTNTDPNSPLYNSTLAMEIEAAKNRSLEVAAQMAQQETQTGLSAASQLVQDQATYTSQALAAAGLSDRIYQQIAQLQLQQDQGLQKALSGFSTATGYGAGLAAMKDLAQIGANA
jgi:hypothetical protein